MLIATGALGFKTATDKNAEPQPRSSWAQFSRKADHEAQVVDLMALRSALRRFSSKPVPLGLPSPVSIRESAGKFFNEAVGLGKAAKQKTLSHEFDYRNMEY
eukprot:s1387_g9.t1